MKRAFILFILLSLLTLIFSGQLIAKQKTYIYLSMQTTFNTDSEIKFTLGGRGYNEATLNLYKVNIHEILSYTKTSKDLSKIVLKDKKLLKTWKEKVKKGKSWGRYKYLTLKPLKAGAYILEAKANNKYKHKIFMVSDLTITYKADKYKTLFYTADSKYGKPLVNTKIVAHTLKMKPLFKGFTNKKGLFLINKTITTSNIILASYKNHYAFLNYYLPYESPYYKYKVFTYTDRPIYRPNQKVSFKVLIREKIGSLYKLPGTKKINVEVKSPKGDSIYKKKLSLNNYGALSGSLKLAEGCALGQYYITLRFKNLSYYAYFRVEEYRKPEYKLQISSDKDHYIQKEKISFNIKADYYFGEPLKKAKIKYQLFRANYYQPWWYDYNYPWYFEESSYRSYSYWGASVKSGKGTTDDKGKFNLDFQISTLNRTVAYTLSISVMDKSNREVIDTYRVLVYPSGIKLKVKTGRYLYAPYETIKLRVQTNDLKNKPTNSKITLNIFREKYNNKKWVKEHVSDYHFYTKNGFGSYMFTPTKEGYYHIIAKTKDSYGFEVSQRKYVYVFKRGGYGFYRGSDLDIVLDKKSYKPGDTAKILINCAENDPYILLTVEGESLLHYQVIKARQNTAYAEIKITKKFSPNAHIYATKIINNGYNYRYKKIVVPPEENFLNIKIISNKSVYKPGEKAYFKVIAKDNRGRPVRAEVSLGVVDEAIYALHEDKTTDIRKFFYGLTYNKVRTGYSFYYYFKQASKLEALDEELSVGSSADKKGARMAKEKSKDGYASKPSSLVQPKLRKFFPDTAYWGAHIRTNHRGIAYASFKVPDTLTTWRATSRAITRGTKVGQITQTTITKKDLIVRPELPRFFTQGDEEKIVAIVHNYMKTSKKVYVKLEAPGLEIKESKEKSLYISPNSDVRVEWSAKAAKVGKTKIKITALTNEVSDAVEIKVPIQPHGIAYISTNAGELNNDKTITFNLIPESIPETVKLNIGIAPSLAGVMFSSLEYLVGYPYGCVEQTMSRFLPDVIVAQAYKKLGRKLPPKLEKNLPLYVKKGLEKLYNYQNSDGSWGWWKHDSGNPYLTAYVMYGLFKAKEAGYLVKKNVFKSGLIALENMLKTKTNLNTKCYMLYVLSEIGEKNRSLAGSLYWKRGSLKKHYAKALLAIILKNHGMDNDAKNVIKELSKSATHLGSAVFWGGRKGYYRWMDNKVEATAYVLKAFIKVDPKNVLVKKAIRYLITSRRGNRWYSTKDTAAAVMTLTDYMVQFEKLAPDYTLNIFANDKLVKSLKVSSEDLYKPEQKLVLKFKDLNKGINSIRIQKLGTGNCYYSTSLSYFKAVDKITAKNAGFEVKRSYSLDGKNFTTKPIKTQVGQVLHVKLEVNCDVPYEYTMIEDYLPSGFEIVRKTTRYGYSYYRYWWYVYRETRDNRMVFFSTYLSKGKHTLTYKIKPEIPGTMKWLPAQASLMYFPEVQGNSDENIITVEP